MPAFPIARYLVPEATPQIPETFTLLETTLAAGLPHTFDLGAGLKLAVALPTGLAERWRHLRLDEVVAASQPEAAPFGSSPEWASLEPVARAPLFMALKHLGKVVATWPLVAGSSRVIGVAGAKLAIATIGWKLCAGNVLGSGELGSKLVLAYRRLERGVDKFSELPPHPNVVIKLVKEGKYMASELGSGRSSTMKDLSARTFKELV